jgi:hypothetical protein
MGYQPVNSSIAKITIPSETTPFPQDAEYNRTTKGMRRRSNEHSTRRSQRLDHYLTREFVAWDGEGINEPDGSHTYVMLASSDGQSLHHRFGLSTVDVFELWLESRSGVTNVIYGGGYDINMVLRDLDRVSLTQLYATGRVRWNGYRIEWRGGKSISVRTTERSFLLYDVLPFFQKPFVSACDEYLGEEWEYRDEIIREKANRGAFTYDNIAGISEYNAAELRTLVRLANELRERLHKASIRVARWDGPGAIASALYKKHATKSHLVPSPPMVATAGRHAYAGGRFEIIRKGHSDLPCYQYDVNSAYPSAIRDLPCLAHGEWKHVLNPTRVARFGMYRIEVAKPIHHTSRPQPLWHRNKDGTVFFSQYPHGWYWSPEARLVAGDSRATIHEGWEMVVCCDCNPFGFVEGLYNKRLALKKAGDGAQVGLKLGLNLAVFTGS